MELLQTLALLLVIFVAWLYLAKFISDNYQKSSGISSLFWVILLLFTASFLFGSGGGSSSSGGGSGNYDENDEDDGYCNKSWFDNDSSSCDSSNDWDDE